MHLLPWSKELTTKSHPQGHSGIASRDGVTLRLLRHSVNIFTKLGVVLHGDISAHFYKLCDTLNTLFSYDLYIWSHISIHEK